MISTPYDTRSSNKPTKSHAQDSIPSFIRKTYDILTDRKYPDVIDWNPEGTALVIKKPTDFCQKVLPLYFKHNNLTSFVRQLNMYNFHKRRTQNIDHVYYHELFQRGKKHLLKEIRRKSHESHSEKYPRSENTENLQPNSESSSIMYENQFLKRLYNDAMSKISLFESQIQDLINQNNSLRSQLFEPQTQSHPQEPNQTEQWAYKSVPASLDVKVESQEIGQRGPNEVAIPPLKIKAERSSLKATSGVSNYMNTEDSTEPTEASSNSPNIQPAGMEAAEKNYEMAAPSLPASGVSQGLEAQPAISTGFLNIARGETSIGRMFENWHAQNTEVNNNIDPNSLLGKRESSIGLAGIGAQFEVPEGIAKRELSLFARKGLISTGIEDKELMKMFMQRGVSEDFNLDLMSFTN